MKRDEPGLKALFQAMRASDAQRAPGFARVLARPAPRDLGYLRALALVAAIVLVAVLATAGLARRREPAEVRVSEASAPAWPSPPTTANVASARDRSPATQESLSPAPVPKTRRAPAAASLSEWKSPTAALLEVPGDDLWTSVPSIGSTTSALQE